MKIEPTQIAGASLIAEDMTRDASRESATADASTASLSSEPAMRYEDLLPYLLLPIAGAY